MNKFKQKLFIFMQGRYGVDELYNFLLIVYLVIFLINCFVHSDVLSFVCLIVLFFTVFRVVSKNISARQKERAKYLILKNKFKNSYSALKKRFSDKEHVYRTCHHCKATLRFPKKKGSHDAVCPKCKKALKIRILF